MNTKKGLISVLALVIASLLAVSGCASGGAPPASTPVKAPTAAPTTAPKVEPAAATPVATKPPSVVSPTPSPKPVTMKWGSAAGINDMVMFMAIERGFFKELGITVEIIPAPSLSEQIAILAKGDLDIAIGGFTPGIPNAVARGVPVKIIADGGSILPDFSPVAVSVRKDLYDSGSLRTAADLKGKKMAVTALQTQSRLIAPLLAQSGLTLKDINFIPLSFQDAVAAYANKGIDAAVQLEPLLSQTVAQGLAVVLKRVSDYRPGFQSGVVLASPQFIQNKDMANKWAIAYVRGVRAFLDAVSSGKGVDEISQIGAKYTPVKDRAIYETMIKEKTLYGFNPNGYVNKESLAADMNHFLAEAYMTEPADAGSMIDSSLIDYAVQQLGKRGQ